MKRYFIIGGAGFIGSHLARALLAQEKDAGVIIYDNFSSGKMLHLEGLESNHNFQIIKDDVKNKNSLVSAMKGIDIVYHFASNPDIAKALTQPDIDFWEGTYLTNNVLEAMRLNNIKKLFYASGSGIYGDSGSLEIEEDYAPMLPISAYGASKLSCEAMICAYCHMFGMAAAVFRFANVVGPHQTHGVGFDFIRKLRDNPKVLLILGDGSQSKPYVYISDVISAMRLTEKKALPGFSYYNVSTGDYLTVKEIADITVKIMGLENVKYNYTGGKRGWKGDVPVVRLNSEKIRNLGWRSQYTAREAVLNSLKSLCQEVKERV